MSPNTDPQTDPYLSPAASSPETPPFRSLMTRSGSVRRDEDIEGSAENSDKPSGKRKFKSKHLSDGVEQKVRTSMFSSSSSRCLFHGA